MLPRDFRPDGTFDLVRLGRDADGGYLVEPHSIQQAGHLIGMGLSTDWSFEASFARQNSAPIDVYDHTVTTAFWRHGILTRIAKTFLLTAGIEEAFRAIRLYWDYRRFFRGDHRHFIERIGAERQQATSLSRAFARRQGSAPVFLKIDIEGDEYRILDQVVEHASELCGLVIEFHHVHRARNQIRGFIRDLPLALVHIHPNNFGGVDDEGSPKVLEMTFAKNPTVRQATHTLPHPLDQPNNPKWPELQLVFDQP